MRRFVAIGLLLLFSGGVLANGLGGGDVPPARIPIPARDFKAIVEDQQGTRVEVTQASWNGEVFLYGNVGEGQVTVAFENIAEVRVEPSQDSEKRVAFVKLKDGQSVSVVIDADVPAYGRTPYGTYSITADKIRKIEFP
jgi:hypothetical protein